MCSLAAVRCAMQFNKVQSLSSSSFFGLKEKRRGLGEVHHSYTASELTREYYILRSVEAREVATMSLNVINSSQEGKLTTAFVLENHRQLRDKSQIIPR